MAGTTYSRFFWQDWASDPKLFQCSPGAQALWMRCLCLASQSDRVGHVLVGSKKPSDTELARITGFSPTDVTRWREEIVANEVCDVDRSGVMVSRRMVKDARKHESSVKGGKTRQKQRIETTGEIPGSSRTPAQPPLARVQSPESISQNPPPTPKGESDLPSGKRKDAGRLATLSQLLNLDYSRHTLGTIYYIQQLIELEQAGIDIEADLIPCIEQMKADGRNVDGKPFSYFRKPALNFQKARALLAEVQKEIEQADPIAVPESSWPRLLTNFLFCGYWDMRTGPVPVQEGCRAPEALLRPVRNVWNGALGQRSFARLLDNFYIPIWWPDSEQYFGKDLTVEDMNEYIATGIDPRKRPPGMVADNVVPLRKAV